MFDRNSDALAIDEEGIGVPDAIPHRDSRVEILRKPSARVKRKYTIEVMERADGTWVAVVGAQGPLVRDMCIGTSEHPTLHPVLSQVVATVLQDEVKTR